MNAIDLTGFSIGFIAFVMGWVVLGITVHTKRQLGPQGGAKGNGAKKRGPSKRPPPKKGAGGAKSGWA